MVESSLVRSSAAPWRLVGAYCQRAFCVLSLTNCRCGPIASVQERIAGQNAGGYVADKFETMDRRAQFILETADEVLRVNLSAGCGGM